METETFKKKCDGVVFLEELPPLSDLRQKAAGCYAAFGMCPEGQVVGLDMNGEVNCLSADVNNGDHFCGDDGSLCRLKAEPIYVLGAIDLLSSFSLENFLKKENNLAA
jgi:hypothetical protein